MYLGIERQVLMKKTSVLSAAFACILAISLTASATNARQAEQQAKDILDATDVRGGLVVHIGCRDGRLTAALCANDSYIVQGLDKDAENISTN